MPNYTNKTNGTIDYYLEYIADFAENVVRKDLESSSEFETELPSSEKEMLNFIKAFTQIYPYNDTDFEKYISNLKAIELLEENDIFIHSPLYTDIVDYVRSEILDDLKGEILTYPHIESNSYFDYFSFIETLNDELGFSGVNSEVIETESKIESTIEAEHHTTIIISLNRIELEDHYRNDSLKFFVVNEYYRKIQNFSIDEEFNMLWDSRFIKETGYTPREFIKMLEEDKMFFTNTIRDAIQLVK